MLESFHKVAENKLQSKGIDVWLFIACPLQVQQHIPMFRYIHCYLRLYSRLSMV